MSPAFRSVPDAFRLALERRRRVRSVDDLEVESLLKVSERLERYARRDPHVSRTRIWLRVREGMEPRSSAGGN